MKLFKYVKFIIPGMLIGATAISSFVLINKPNNDRELFDLGSRSSKSNNSIDENVFNQEIASFKKDLTNSNQPMKFNTQMLYSQFGDFLSNNLNTYTAIDTDGSVIPTVTFNSQDIDLATTLKPIINKSIQTVWSTANLTTNQPNGVLSTTTFSTSNYSTMNPNQAIDALNKTVQESGNQAIASGGTPTIKFTTKSAGGNAGNKKILQSLDGFDNQPYHWRGRPNLTQHTTHGPVHSTTSYRGKGKIVGGTIQGNSLFGESLLNNSSRRVNYFSIKNNATNEVTSSNSTVIGSDKWVGSVIYPFSDNTTNDTTGWYLNTGITTTNLGSWATTYADQFFNQIQTTQNSKATFGTQASIQTIKYKIGKAQVKVLDSNNVAAYFRMYSNTNNVQNNVEVAGKRVSDWYSYNYISNTKPIMSGTTTYLGNTEVEDTLQNINYDLSKLITVDTTNTSNYFNSSNEVWTVKAPQVKFTYNLKLFTALREAYQISKLVKTINANTNLDNDVKNMLNTTIYPSILKGTCDYDKLNDYYTRASTGAEVNPIFNELTSPAKYWTTIKNNDWTLPTSSIKDIESWSIPYSFIIPTIFSNDIYVKYTATGSSNVEEVKIYDASTQNWKYINVINNGQQFKTFNNNVEMNFSEFTLKKVGTSQKVNSKGLSPTNIYKNTTQYLDSNASKRISLAANNLSINFAYNPSLANLIHSVTTQYSSNTYTLKALYDDNSIYVSDLYETGFLTQDKIDSYTNNTKKQLAIPDSLVNATQTKRTFSANSFKTPVTNDIPNKVLNSSEATDLKKFLNLSDAYERANNINDNSETTLRQRLAAKKQLDNLGYYYLVVESSIPIGYYATEASWKQFQADKTFVKYDIDSKDGQEKPLSNGYYRYYVKYATTKRPLNIDELSKYITITNSFDTTTTNSDINEIKTVDEVKEKLTTLDQELKTNKTKLSNLITTSNSTQDEIDTLNKQIDSLLSDLVTNNPDLAQASNSITTKYQTQINEVNQKIDDKKQEFDKNKNFKGSGFIKHLSKTLDYTTELKDLTNLYENKLNDLGTLFTNSEPVIKVQKQVQTLTSNMMEKVNSLTSEINTLTKKLTSLSQENTALLNKLNQITKLTYTTTVTKTNKIDISYNLSALKLASDNRDLESYYSLLSENNLSDYFYVTKTQFANKLNEIIQVQTKINPQLNATNLIYSKEGITEGNNSYGYTYNKNSDTLTSLIQNIEIKEIKEQIHEVNVNNNPKIKESDFVSHNVALLNISTTDATTLLSNIIGYKATIQQNQTTILNSINELATNLTNLTKKASDINEYNNSASLYPDYIKTQSTLNQVKDELENYKPTTVTLTQLNSMLIWITVAISVAALVLLIAAIIYAKSKKQAKTIKTSEKESQPIDDFVQDFKNENSKKKGF